MSGRMVVVLGDQLDEDSAAFDGFNPKHDVVWMCEVPEEARVVWSHKARIAIFLAAMRHFRQRLEARGWRVLYRATGEHPYLSLAQALVADVQALRPKELIMVAAGEWRLVHALDAAAAQCEVPLRKVEDRHFLVDETQFAQWMGTRKQPRLEHFYRWMRRRTGLLMAGEEPVGGEWNFDADNRSSFGSERPRAPARLRFRPDALTREVLDLVQRHYADHPGDLEEFDWPVTREEALETLDDFVVSRLPQFGQWQDAMWTGEPWLWHSHLSAALNLKLLHPREVCEAVVTAWRSGDVPLASAEGFIRQIIGWREYVRGLYWLRMPAYLEENALDAREELPAFYWTGKTDFVCLSDAIGQTLRYGYAHHIQRLMVTGLFALLLGVRPARVHEWYLAVYVDAVEWVELPNTIGMSQYGDGGLLASKPYIASGKYLQRMSNACAQCRFDPAVATGPRACPFTTLYWDFLDRHEARFEKHPRLRPQMLNLQRKPQGEREAICEQARQLRARLADASNTR